MTLSISEEQKAAFIKCNQDAEKVLVETFSKQGTVHKKTVGCRCCFGRGLRPAPLRRSCQGVPGLWGSRSRSRVPGLFLPPCTPIASSMLTLALCQPKT
jgi:hypothetical protein